MWLHNPSELLKRDFSRCLLLFLSSWWRHILRHYRTCDLSYSTAHQVRFFRAYYFPLWTRVVHSTLSFSVSQKCWKAAWRPRRIHHFLHFSSEREGKFGCYWEADLAWQFNIKPPTQRDALFFLCLVWLRWLEPMKNARLLSSVAAGGTWTRWELSQIAMDWLEHGGGESAGVVGWDAACRKGLNPTPLPLVDIICT